MLLRNIVVVGSLQKTVSHVAPQAAPGLNKLLVTSLLAEELTASPFSLKVQG